MPEANSNQNFIDLLDSYFGDQTRDEGLSEIVSVSRRNAAFHADVVAAINAAIAASANCDAAILDAVRDRFLRFRRDDDAVREFLAELHKEYMRQYRQATTAPN